MRPVSETFQETVRGSHVITARARIVETFQTGTAPTGTLVPILGGDVILDGSADVRGTLELVTDGAGMWPSKPTSLVAPFGNDVFVERGIAYGNGTTEWVSLGYFRIYTPEQESAPDGPIRIAARDRMSGIVDARLLNTVQFTAGLTLGQIVDQLVTEVYPAAVIEWDDATDEQALTRPMVAEEDRWRFLQDLVTARGKIWYFDYRGILVIKDPPDPQTPVLEVAQGEGGVLVSMSRNLSRDGVYNAVVAYGEAGDDRPPARAVAYDDDPDSLTYYFGRFGPVPRYFASPFLTTNNQALSAATAILTQSLGLPYNVDFTAVPNPALEPFDPVAISYPTRSRSQSSRTELHIIERMTVPLLADAGMGASTREQKILKIGSI